MLAVYYNPKELIITTWWLDFGTQENSGPHGIFIF
jgi:hypothetical protein